MIIYIRFFFAALVVASLLVSSALSQTQTESVTLDINGVSRSFHYSAPATTGELPVILSFHGFGGSGIQQEEMSGLTPLALQNGFIAVYPEGRETRSGKRFWATQTEQDIEGDLAFTRAILAHLKAHHQIDPTRIYVTGISNGGGMASTLASHMAKEIAAIAPVSGAYYDHMAKLPEEPVPVLAFHGAKDRIVPIAGRGKLPDIHRWATFWAQSNGCSTQPRTLSATPDVTRERWGNCAAPISLVTLAKGGHSWPGGEHRIRRRSSVDASREIIAFFMRIR